MKRIASQLARAAAIAFALSAGAAVSQTTTNGPYYAVPSWDQSLPAGSRFLVLSNFANNAVLDRETGLVWERSPPLDLLPFRNSDLRCLTATTGGRTGWRLPSFSELRTLFDPAVGAPPFIPAGHPFMLSTAVGTSLWSTKAFRFDEASPVLTRLLVTWDETRLLTRFESNLPATANTICVRAPGE